MRFTKHRRITARPRPRCGFTLIECLVALAVVALLLALLLPAVQSARESARKTTCINNLKQIGLATESFSAQHGTYPTGTIPFVAQNSPAGGEVNYAPHVQLLPFLEQAALAAKYDDAEDGSGAKIDPPTSTVNGDLLATHLPIFACPSDGGITPRNNYRISCGTSTGWHSTEPPYDSNSSLRGYQSLKTRRDATFLDGKSQTAAYSERLSGDGDPDHYTPWRDLVYVASYPNNGVRPNDVLDGCSLPVRAIPQHASFTGATWVLSGYTQTWYNHVLPPNSRIPDCISGLEGVGAYSARSHHPGGVNTLFADGSVHFVSENIDIPVWRALGSIAGGEVVDNF